MEELIVTIKEGDIQVEVQGVKGARCLELTQAIETLLGEISTREFKNDFYGRPKMIQTLAIKQTLGRPFEEVE